MIGTAARRMAAASAPSLVPASAYVAGVSTSGGSTSACTFQICTGRDVAVTTMRFYHAAARTWQVTVNGVNVGSFVTASATAGFTDFTPNVPVSFAKSTLYTIAITPNTSAPMRFLGLGNSPTTDWLSVGIWQENNTVTAGFGIDGFFTDSASVERGYSGAISTSAGSYNGTTTTVTFGSARTVVAAKGFVPRAIANYDVTIGSSTVTGARFCTSSVNLGAQVWLPMSAPQVMAAGTPYAYAIVRSVTASTSSFGYVSSVTSWTEDDLTSGPWSEAPGSNCPAMTLFTTT